MTLKSPPGLRKAHVVMTVSDIASMIWLWLGFFGCVFRTFISCVRSRGRCGYDFFIVALVLKYVSVCRISTSVLKRFGHMRCFYVITFLEVGNRAGDFDELEIAAS